MGFQTSIGPFLSALVANLQARISLDGVKIFSGWVSQEDAGEESIIFGDINPTTDWGLIGKRQLRESYTIEGQIWTQKPGADEATIQEARARSEFILSELIDEIRTNGSQGLPYVQNNTRISDWLETNRVPADGARACVIGFTITVNAIITVP